MRNKNKEIRAHDRALEFLRAGKSVPDAFLQRRIADVKRGPMDRSKGKYAIDKQYAKYWSQIQKPPKVDKERRIAQATDSILGIHKNLAKRKLAAPTVQSELSGIITGRFGGKITPPFDYAFTINDVPSWSFPFYGNPALAGSANKDIGQISNSAASDYQAKSNGNVYSEMGVYFRPLWGPATLSVSANPASSFEWWTNSIDQSGVFSGGVARLGIYARQGDYPEPTEAWSNIGTYWSVFTEDQLRFDWGSNPHAFASTQLNDLDPSFECLLYVAVVNQVNGQGWPGSLAGSVISITVPSITFELDIIQVVNPG